MSQPRDAHELCGVVAEAARLGCPLEARGGGTKREVGSPGRSTSVLDLSRLRGIVDYQPGELILTVRPATPLAEVEELLRGSNQMLAFEPWDYGRILGRGGAATIGGVVAAGVCGSRRVSAGGARDHLLGFAAVSGRGEAFKGGGKVVKNVTGFDIAKVMAGSWGQLAILTELTLKVVPRPRAAVTVALTELTAEASVAAMSRAMGAPCAIAAAAHLPAAGGSPAVTGLRLEGFRESIDARMDQVRGLLADFGDACPLPEDAAADFWVAVRDARALEGAETLWRVHVAASRAAQLVSELETRGARWLLDWAGCLVWVGASAAVDVRAVAQAHQGHAMLLRAPVRVRSVVPARQPQSHAAAALGARLKRAFDPAGILDPARFT